MERLTTLLDGIGAFDESSVIGSKKIWVERLSELNVKVKDFDLISIEPPDPTIPRHFGKPPGYEGSSGTLSKF